MAWMPVVTLCLIAIHCGIFYQYIDHNGYVPVMAMVGASIIAFCQVVTIAIAIYFAYAYYGEVPILTVPRTMTSYCCNNTVSLYPNGRFIYGVHGSSTLDPLWHSLASTFT